ncbi:hypothetical protein SK128_011226 [Halocaridina rubra]|uniref:Uncharacterized protein n=1 Tax=Halocaridina rubra TaxID=373956 RepID=A0AAN8XRF7_HALRR
MFDRGFLAQGSLWVAPGRLTREQENVQNVRPRIFGPGQPLGGPREAGEKQHPFPSFAEQSIVFLSVLELFFYHIFGSVSLSY